MTQPAGPDLSKRCSAAALTQPARGVHRAVLAVFAETGHAPSRGDLERLAAGSGADPAAVLAELADRDLIAFDARGEIRAAYPFSPSPTPIQVRQAAGPVAYAMCAIDALGISAMLGRPVTITAAEPGTGRLVTVEADGDRAWWKPRRAVVFAGATSDHCCPSVDRTCGYINFFTSARAARKWARSHPDITGRVLRRTWALDRGIAEFGAFLRTAEATTGS
jgi:hypothetical protein